MRGLPLYNFPAFDAAELLLTGQGWEVYNPARVDRELDGFDPKNGEGILTIEEYMRRDFVAILDVQAIAMLPGWRRSEGARREHSFATALGIEVLDATTGSPLLEAGDPAYLALLAGMEEMHRAKAAGYSGLGAVDTWANFREAEKWGVSPFKGCMVRLGDKYRRVQNLVKDPANDKVGESILDTLQDMAAYSLIGICLLKEGPDVKV
jgi:hypothetical protein